MAWFCHSCFWRKPLVRWHPLINAMFLIIISGSLSLMVAHFRPMGVVHLASIGMCIVLSVLVTTIIDGRDIKPLLRFMAFALFFLLVVVYFQGNMGTRDAHRVFMESMELEFGDYERISGTLADPNEYCAMLIVMVPLLFCAMMTDEHPLAKWIAGGLGMAFIIGIINTMSRAGMVMGLMCIPPIAWYFRRRISPSVMAIGLAFVIALPVLSKFDTASERWSGLLGVEVGFTGTESLRERAALTRAGVATLKENWVWGVGVGNLLYRHGFVTTDLDFKVVHNTYLQIAAEQGIPGFLAMLVIGWTLFRTLFQSLRYARTPYMRACAFGVLVGIPAWGGMAATLDLSTQSQAYFIFGVAMALHRNIMQEHEKAKKEAQPTFQLVGS